MKQVYIIYKTDTHHSYNSRDIIGISFDEHEEIAKITAIEICQGQAEKEGEEINMEQLFNLNNIKQTQGYSGEGEFQYESIAINKLL
jgi:hypothetical protein